MTVKQALLEWVQQLPEDIELEEVEYEAHVARKIEEGLKAISGRSLSWSEAEALFQDEVERPIH